MKKADKKEVVNKENLGCDSYSHGVAGASYSTGFGWMYMERSMETMTKINIPYA